MSQPSNDHPEQSSSAVSQSNALLPRPPRKRRKSEHDRGLPNDLELTAFAEAYLKASRNKYPQLVTAGVLPEPTPAVLSAMAEDFKERHRGKAPDIQGLPVLAAAAHLLKWAAGYFRYSCDNSNPTSITDQMTNCIAVAAEEGRFIPWQFVYADYSVTGRDASRLGYQSAKKAIKGDDNSIDTLYIDDFSRASRDAIEWWRLAALLRRLKKRMIGASDQFDLSSPASDTLISVFALVSKLFVESLQQKVMRGMLGAVGRGTVVGKLSLGFTRQPKQDAQGSSVLGGDGRPTNGIAIDPVTAPIRRLIFELFVHEQWSVQRIRKHFNKLRMDGWNGWTNKAIRDLLASPTAIGKFVWNKTRREFDPEEEEWVTKTNPPEDHRTFEDPSLALVSVELWEAAQARLAEIHSLHAAQGRRSGRNQANPTTLFSGTMFCACCGKEITLRRSVGEMKQMGSLNGSLGLHDCQLTSSKSVKIIEKCLLETLQQVVLRDEVVESLVARANQILEEEGAKPPPGVTEQQSRLRQIDAEIKRLVRRSAATEDDAIAVAFEAEIRRLRAERDVLTAEVKAAERATKLRSERIDLANAKQLLGNLQNILNQDPATAGLALRRLFGRIQVRQELITGTQNRYRWIAMFTPQYAQLLAQLLPLGGGEFLASRTNWTAEPLEVVIDQVPRYERLAPEIKRLHDKGSSISQIASALGMVWQQVRESLEFAETGKRPYNKPKKKRTGRGRQSQRYVELSGEVVKLRESKMPFSKIAIRLGVNSSTVRRAYDHAQQAEVAKAAEAGTTMKRGKYSHLSAQTWETIARLAGEGKSIKEIAVAAGCSEKSVRRYLKNKGSRASSAPV